MVMKLGSESISLVNHLYSREVIGEPKAAVGMGASMLCWSDRRAGSIVEVIEVGGVVKRVCVQEDNAVRVDRNGMSECQDYEFSANPNGSLYWFGKDRKGMWVELVQNERGRWVQSRGHGLKIGVRDKYHDYSF